MIAGSNPAAPGLHDRRECCERCKKRFRTDDIDGALASADKRFRLKPNNCAPRQCPVCKIEGARGKGTGEVPSVVKISADWSARLSHPPSLGTALERLQAPSSATTWHIRIIMSVSARFVGASRHYRRIHIAYRLHRGYGSSRSASCSR